MSTSYTDIVNGLIGARVADARDAAIRKREAQEVALAKAQIALQPLIRVLNEVCAPEHGGKLYYFGPSYLGPYVWQVVSRSPYTARTGTYEIRIENEHAVLVYSAHWTGARVTGGARWTAPLAEVDKLIPTLLGVLADMLRQRD